jgi:hypothetical protein
MAENDWNYLIGQRLSISVGMNRKMPENLYVAEEKYETQFKKQMRFIGEGHFSKRDVVEYVIGGIYFLDVEKCKIESGKPALSGKLSKRLGRLTARTGKEIEVKPVDGVELIIDKLFEGKDREWKKIGVLSS